MYIHHNSPSSDLLSTLNYLSFTLLSSSCIRNQTFHLFLNTSTTPIPRSFCARDASFRHNNLHHLHHSYWLNHRRNNYTLRWYLLCKCPSPSDTFLFPHQPINPTPSQTLLNFPSIPFPSLSNAPSRTSNAQSATLLQP